MNNPDILHRVPVTLGDRSYNIVIGRELVPHAAGLVKPFLKRSFVAIVTDTNVAKSHLARLEESFKLAGIETKSIILPAGEATKSYKYLAELCDGRRC
jgi:3-dehydroquinate synthase